jgi:hypothetical protein
MGLDMYLDKEIYIGANYDFHEIGGEIALTRKGNKIPINLKKIKSITEEGIYWRKANQIHKWFVDNVQDGNDDCGRYYVSKDTLQTLLDTINNVFEKVSKHIDLSSVDFDKMDETEFNTKANANKDVIEEICGNLLPTRSGFFFGGISYDFFYFYDLNYTKRELEKLLNDIGEDEEISFYYHSSW